MEYIRTGLKNIFRKKFRTTMTIMGIAIGVCSVVIIGSVGNIGTNLLNDELATLGIGGVTIGVDSKLGEHYLYMDDLEVVDALAEVKSAVPIMMEYTNSYCRSIVINTAVWGIGKGSNQIFSLELIHGRLFTQADISGNEQYCIVDEDYALKTYKRSNIVGKSVFIEFNGTQVELEVIGVVRSGGAVVQTVLSGYIPVFLYMPYTTMEAFGGKSYFDQICIEPANDMDEALVAALVIRALEEKNNIKNGYKFENVTQQKDNLNNILTIVTMGLSIIAGISLVVAGLSIMTVMMVSVNERTREIGIKKSVGATKSNIMLEFMIEAFFITLLGSLLGFLFGAGIAYVACQIFGFTFSLNKSLTIFCICFSLVIGIVFGVYPAKKASELRPVDALRSD